MWVLAHNTGDHGVVIEHLSTDGARTTGVGLLATKDKNTSSTSPVLELEHDGSGAHIRFIGDPTVSNPQDGDLWFDGTTLKLRVGTTTYNITMVPE